MKKEVIKTEKKPSKTVKNANNVGKTQQKEPKIKKVKITQVDVKNESVETTNYVQVDLPFEPITEDQIYEFGFCGLFPKMNPEDEKEDDVPYGKMSNNPYYDEIPVEQDRYEIILAYIKSIEESTLHLLDLFVRQKLSLNQLSFNDLFKIKEHLINETAKYKHPNNTHELNELNSMLKRIDKINIEINNKLSQLLW